MSWKHSVLGVQGQGLKTWNDNSASEDPVRNNEELKQHDGFTHSEKLPKPLDRKSVQDRQRQETWIIYIVILP